VTIVEQLNEFWNSALQTATSFVIPDWGALIALLPVFIFVGVVGPFLTFTVLGALYYQARKPRVKLTFEEGPRKAELDADGAPVFPPGLPFCRRDATVYPSGTLRCEACADALAVSCPMCGLGRMAALDTCGNCGLVLKVKTRAVAVRATPGPKPGGAAAA
jgi:hypothetical protein